MGSGSFNEVKPITDFLATFGQPNPERFNDRASIALQNQVWPHQYAADNTGTPQKKMKSPSHDPVRMAAHLRAFIGAKQYDELFSQGGCFHFAQCSWKRGIGTLRRTVSGFDPTKADHVFVVAQDGPVFDRLGYRTAHDLLNERKSDHGQNRAMAPDEVETHILSMGIPEELHQEIFAIADELIVDMKVGVEPKTRTMRAVSQIPEATYAADHEGKRYYFNPTAAEIQMAIDDGALEERGYQSHKTQLIAEWHQGAHGRAEELFRLQKESQLSHRE
jgi:hypothetical protein